MAANNTDKRRTLLILAIWTLLIGIIINLSLGNDFKYQWIYPFVLLFSPFRETTLKAWESYGKIDTRVLRPSAPIPEILSSDYNYEVLKIASNNFRNPVVVRGLFLNTTAVHYWKSAEYLSSKLGNYTIPIVRNAIVGTLQDDRVLVNFEESFRQLLALNYSKEYLFFPVKSRFTFNGSEAGRAAQLQNACDQLCVEDLELDRIWRGFASKRHSSFAGSQFVIGKSTEEFTNISTGSDWHCAAGNNWFIQAAGRKYWEFVEPRYSAYMSPLKGGFFNMWTGNKQMARLQKHIPTKFTVLEEGDLLYNPDWTWHKVTNYGGLSIGVPIRERNFTLMFQNNPFFTSIVVVNRLLSEAFGLSLGGFPPPSPATEADN